MFNASQRRLVAGLSVEARERRNVTSHWNWIKHVSNATLIQLLFNRCHSCHSISFWFSTFPVTAATRPLHMYWILYSSCQCWIMTLDDNTNNSQAIETWSADRECDSFVFRTTKSEISGKNHENRGKACSKCFRNYHAFDSDWLCCDVRIQWSWFELVVSHGQSLPSLQSSVCHTAPDCLRQSPAGVQGSATTRAYIVFEF